MPHTHISTKKWQWTTFQLAVAFPKISLVICKFYIANFKEREEKKIAQFSTVKLILQNYFFPFLK